MTKTLEFWFDFSSPYAYLAAQKIDDLAARAGRETLWRPFLLGVVFGVTGNGPLTRQPIKGDYTRHDLERMARYMDVDWHMPDKFPIPTQHAARAFYWIDKDDPDTAKKFARVAFNAYFARNIDISPAQTVLNIAAGCNVDPDVLGPAVQTPEAKQALRDRTDEAMKKGVCGSPFFIVDGEGFWGSDRMWMVKKWMQQGGW